METEVYAVIIGWLLGVLSTPLGMYFTGIVERRRFANVLKEELKEVRFRLGVTIRRLRMLRVIIVAIGSFLVGAFVGNKIILVRDEASTAECTGEMSEISAQMESAKKIYGTYPLNLESLKVSENSHCKMIRGESTFAELSPKFEKNEYRIYFRSSGSKGALGKLESGKILWID